MKHKIYSVFDSGCEAYMQPFFMQAHGQAIRAMSDMASDPSHQFGKHPEDYTLFYLGEFDDGPGKFEMETTPMPLCKAIECVQET